ncbi:tRNA pseudouridine synthase A [Saprolegnia diclina VS20]|uniref:tRNA pseudouridine synthase n=1 Tax=Saprolegnia diclina (strain VS20) TaxID=1156394 RepID=T0RFA0_SAPDV|nr:tRNA pseudouridine synthase A [Saprolegnia diclina VS20]EQC30953.1 tRNA pseudouridine synthase A [Saprolegnia diclina VS20]|eukprot:XP_008615691.1 tRNA pseudouridine synthase A [Saprolegnia diclina VS20]
MDFGGCSMGEKRKRGDRPTGSFVVTDATAPPSTYCVTLAYDGKAFNGYQAQEKTPPVRTVQATLEDAIKRTTGEVLRVRGASRTDRGVHARGQEAAFESTVVDASVLLRAINNRLPDDVAITRLVKVADGFDPRKASTHKCYSYRIFTGEIRQVLGRDQAWQVCKPLDVALMREAANLLESSTPRDCSAFTPTRRLEEDMSTLCAVRSIELASHEKEHELTITFQGDRFLYRMVRNMVGLLVHVGLHKKTLEDVQAMVDANERIESPGAPAHGLTLEWIRFE